MFRKDKSTNVDDFVDEKASAFNMFQQGQRVATQRIQSKASKVHTFLQISTSAEIWFGTKCSTYVRLIYPEVNGAITCIWWLSSEVICLHIFYPISTPLRKRAGARSYLLENLLIRNERHGRCEPLFSIDRQFAKVEVAGSNPVSRSFFSIASTVTFWNRPSKLAC
jgi:hypothetical protein